MKRILRGGRLAVVRLHVVWRCAHVDAGAGRVATAHARRSERVGVLDSALRWNSVIAAVERKQPKALNFLMILPIDRILGLASESYASAIASTSVRDAARRARAQPRGQGTDLDGGVGADER